MGFQPAEALGALTTNGVPSAIAIYGVWVDGKPLQFPDPMPLLTQSPNQSAQVETVGAKRLRVPSFAHRTEFRFGPNPSSSNQPVRLHYELEGIDKEWREAGGEMRLNVRFLDATDGTVERAGLSSERRKCGLVRDSVAVTI